jgi:hypothetical protein
LFALVSPTAVFVAQAPPESKHGVFVSLIASSLVLSDAALCVELLRASIQVPVHAFGNLCKTFFRASRKTLSALAIASTRRDVPLYARSASKFWA